MKIAIYHNLPHGGALRTVYEQIKGLSAKHDIDLYEIQQNKYKDLNKFVRRNYLFEFKLINNLPGLFNRLFKDYRNFVSLYYHNKKIAEIIDKRNYDAVLVHSCMWTESPFILRFLKTPNIYHCHELLRIAYEKVLEIDKDLPLIKKLYESANRKIRKYVDLNNARSAHKIITSSDFIRDKVKDVYQMNAVTYHAGVDTNVYKKDKKSNVKENLLYIGDKYKLKGYDLAKESIEIVNKKVSTELLAIGVGKKVAYVKDDKQLALIYSKSIATICPAREEPFGLAPLESMACETPVLAVNEGGYKETVIDGITGYLLPRNPNAFAEKILYLMKNPKIVKIMGKSGRDHVKKNFSWREHNKKLEHLLLSIK